MKRIVLSLTMLFFVQQVQAEDTKQLQNVPYGEHPRQVLDFYQAKSETPTPVVFYIHGGGWQGGDKKTNPQAFLDKGISVVAINYRYGKNAVDQRVFADRTRFQRRSTDRFVLWRRSAGGGNSVPAYYLVGPDGKLVMSFNQWRGTWLRN